MKTTKILAITAAALLAAACSVEPADYTIHGNATNAAGSEITFLAADQRIVTSTKGPEIVMDDRKQVATFRNAEGVGMAKVTVTSEDMAVAVPTTKTTDVTSLSSINILATTGSAGSETNRWSVTGLSPSGSPAVYNTGHYWPSSSSDPGYHFYASNATMSFAAAGPTVSASSSTDVVCAYMSRPKYGQTNTLAFEHIFAQIGDVYVFNHPDGYTVSNLSITLTPKTSGTYNLRTGVWSSLTTGSSTVISRTSTSDTTPKTNNLYLVPGEYTLTANWTVSGTDVLPVSITNYTASITITKGKIHHIAIEPFGTPTIKGYLDGQFSIASNQKVKFSKGLLAATISSGPTNTYNYTASDWYILDKQYQVSAINDTYTNSQSTDYDANIGNTNIYFEWVGASATYNTYGLNNFMCSMGSETLNYSSQTPYCGSNATETLKTDWGSIPALTELYGEGFFTLTAGQWNYLLQTRSNASSKFASAKVNNIFGIILLPDSWTKPSKCSFTSGWQEPSSVVNIYTLGASGTNNAWCDMESAGAVFLPRLSMCVRAADSDQHSFNSSSYNKIYTWTKSGYNRSGYVNSICASPILYQNSSPYYTTYGIERYNKGPVRLVYQ